MLTEKILFQNRGLAFFQKKNLPPFFLLKIASLMAETNFTLGPTSKTNKFHLLFLVIVGQNSQHKRANLNGRTPLDIYSNNFRPSVKPKTLSQNRSLPFYYHPRPPSPQTYGPRMDRIFLWFCMWVSKSFGRMHERFLYLHVKDST